MFSKALPKNWGCKMPASAAMKKLLTTKKINILDLFEDGPDPPEPVMLHSPSEAFNIRVRSAVAMLRLEIDAADVRQRHGMIVLREARAVIAKIEAARKGKQ